MKLQAVSMSSADVVHSRQHMDSCTFCWQSQSSAQPQPNGCRDRTFLTLHCVHPLPQAGIVGKRTAIITVTAETQMATTLYRLGLYVCTLAELAHKQTCCKSCKHVTLLFSTLVAYLHLLVPQSQPLGGCSGCMDTAQHSVQRVVTVLHLCFRLLIPPEQLM